MRKSAVIFCIALAAAACTRQAPSQQASSLMEASRQELADAVKERDELLAVVREISASMDQIRHIENVMTVAGARSRENPDQRTRVLADVEAIRRTLRQRALRLDSLETALSASAMYTEELSSTVEAIRSQLNYQSAVIDDLGRQLAQAGVRIDDLTTQVDSLNQTVDSVNTELDVAHQAAIRLENEINTCYYIAAPKNELRRANILQTGFLRKSRLMRDDFDRASFVIADKRSLNVIHVNSDKARILSTHPEGSYSVSDSVSLKTITILRPEVFWSLTNYLVVQTD